MKRLFIFSFLVSCSSPTTDQCVPRSCSDMMHDGSYVCGMLDDGCGKQLDCGPCSGSSSSSGGGSSCEMTTSVSSSTSATSSSSSSSGASDGTGGTNMCQDLTFDK